MITCPALWLTAPSMLVPVMPKILNLIHTVITIRLSTAPARLYIITDILPNSSADSSTLTKDTIHADLVSIFTMTTIVTRFARPSFTPGTAIFSGISDSMYENTIAIAMNIPIYAILFALHLLLLTLYPLPVPARRGPLSPAYAADM